MAGTSDLRHWRAPGAALLVSSAIAFPCRSQEVRPPDAELNTVLFASLDGMRPGYASAGFKRTLEASLDRSGPATLLSFGFGREPISGARGFRHKAAASALVGWQWLLPSITLSGFVGPELEHERETAAPGQRGRPQGGVRAQAELWAHPTPETLLTATAIAGTARGHLWSRASAGYAVWRRIYIGPEMSQYRTDDFREWRLGAHATGITLGRFNLRLSAGVTRRDERTGGYGSLTGYIRM